jgi:hypothetical protein
MVVCKLYMYDQYRLEGPKIHDPLPREYSRKKTTGVNTRTLHYSPLYNVVTLRTGHHR